MNQLVEVKAGPIVESKTKKPNVGADCKEFGRRLQAAMDKVGVTQADVARFVNMSRSAVNLWISGNNYPSIDNAKLLAAHLRTTPEYLVFGAVKVQKERLVDSINVIDRVSGEETLVTKIAIPREFMARANLPATNNLRAVTVFSDKPVEGVSSGDLLIADVTNKMPTNKPSMFILDNGTVTDPAMVKKLAGNKIHVEMHGEQFDMELNPKLVVGRVVAHLAATN